MEMPKPSDAVFMALLAEQAERYEEMLEWMTSRALQCVVLTQEERNLLSVAGKNAAGSKRASARILASLEVTDGLVARYTPLFFNKLFSSSTSSCP